MHLSASVVLLITVLAGALIISSFVYETIVYGDESQEYSKAKQVMSTIDSSINYMLSDILDSREVYINVYKGSFSVSDEHDIIKYMIEMETESAHEGNLIITSSDNKTEILLNYSGRADIIGNISKSNAFILYLEKSNDQILVK